MRRPEPPAPMDGAELREIREGLGWSHADMAIALGHTDGGRAIRRWQAGQVPIRPVVAIAIRAVATAARR